ncbi:MAG TPA: D-galactonate dehydratase family protein [Bacteroidales bacterium]|nr:D-galactonate dehydratase family protein [Bacteroidales bacterium]HRR92722.1 D-galactonate dehydratase family protein [Bacteroidales bacterium]
MKITDARVIVCSPGRNFVTLKIFTDQGIYGLGDATLNGMEKSVATYLTEYCIPALIGKDPGNIEDIWQYFYRGVYWRRGAVSMTAVSAIDMALWDIKAKLLDTPLYNLLGGRSRDRILVYAHANGANLGEAVENTAREVEKGFKAVRVQCGIPGVGNAYGVVTDKKPYEPAKRGLPPEEIWDTSLYLNYIPKVFGKIREVFGNDLHLLHDVHHRCTPIEAARLAKELEPFHLFWLEDPVACELQESLRLIRQHSTTPVAVGEVFNSVFDYTTLITEQLIDYIRMPLSHGGGITHLQKVAAFASFYHIATGFHGATDLSPVTLAAAIHFNTAINNFGIQEYMPHSEVVGDVFKTNYKFENGFLTIDDSPGIGVDIDEKAAARYPYITARLPVNRKSDGTLFNW